MKLIYAEDLLNTFNKSENKEFTFDEIVQTVNEQSEIICTNEKDSDKIMKINLWLIDKYGKEIREEFNINDNDYSVEGFRKVSQAFEHIYNEQQKKTPLMWYEYGIGGIE